MKFLSAILILITSLALFAQEQNLDFVEKNTDKDWYFELLDEMKRKGIEVNDRSALMRYLQSQQGNDATYDQKRISSQFAKDLLQVIEAKNGKNVQVNLFHNAYFYGEKPKQVRFMSSTNRIKKTNQSKRDKIVLKTNIFYNTLSARDTDNGGTAKASSSENFAVEGQYLKVVNDQIDMGLGLVGSFQSFNAPSGTTLASNSAMYFKLFGEINWYATPLMTIIAGAGVQQLPYLTATGTSASVEKATHPYLSMAVETKLKKYTKLDLRPRLTGEFLNGSFTGDINANTGVTFGLGLAYHFKIRRFRPHVLLNYKFSTQQTNTTDQTTRELGLLMGFYFSF